MLKKLAYGNIIIALAAACQAWLTMGTPLHLSPYQWFLVVLVMVATWLAYSLHRFLAARNNSDGSDEAQRINWWRAPPRVFFLAYILLSVACLAAFRYLPSHVYPMLIACTVMVVLYRSPARWFRGIRYWPFLKLPLIATVWVMVTVLLPYEAFSTNMTCTDVWYVFVERWLFVAAITLPFDMRDAGEDARQGLVTWAIRLGHKRSLMVSFALLLGHAALVVTHGVQTGFYHPYQSLTFIGTAVVAAIWVARGVQQTGELFYLVAIDGLLIIQAVWVAMVQWLFAG
ncbi:MAG: hypothetical protein H6585_12440 [Flavobacteriales bacterium]|nr:hypothetical protein [Flavobacteriales bacterium]MCB9449139.1 hypothetical protein [Flavobacteriales bacterium]